MSKVLIALMTIIQHLIKNFSNYCLAVGLLCILYYIKVTYGTPTLILSVGVVSVLTSFVIEINNSKKQNNTRRW